MGSTIREGGTQHWAGKALSLSNERWLKRARGAALKRDRSRNPLKIKERSEAPVSRYPASLGIRQRLHPFSNRRVPETIERSAIMGTELFPGLQVLPIFIKLVFFN